VTRLPLFLLRFLILMAVVCPQPASAAMGVQLDTRVGGIELVVHALVGGSSARSPEKHLGSSPAYDEIAPGYSLVADTVGTFASGKGAHTALVTVFRDGSVAAADTLVSGGMTAEEAALGFPRSSLATHTEARAVTLIPLREGDTMIIQGQYPPCPTCKGAMNKAAAASGAEIHYIWGDNSWSAGN
jgi:hypothetical protein